MSLLQTVITYAICWWMVLFMVLPFGVEPEAKPEPGHAPSAPAKPRLKRKFIVTSVLALVPTIALYFAVSDARAEDTIYHVGGSGDCDPQPAYKTPEGVNAKAGEGVNGEKVAPADLAPSPFAEQFKSVDIPLKIPSTKYIKADKHNVDMSQSFIEGGTIHVDQDGTTTLNGHSVNDAGVIPEKCKKKAGSK